ncbi:hypothetical protein [Haloferax sp. YSSS75]|uniref:hypothetical protein n=1 Tax=Haloferax sp. YSSS75 TaxID=3388564 RepID=UPI00398CAA37
MTGWSRTRRVFVEMLREEWRLHSHLFSGRRFSAFPVLITLLVAGAVELLVRTGTELTTVFAGLHALAFVFGIQTGSIGFVGRDALRNLLGDLTLLVFSARTLPLSQKRLLAVFVVKDVVYYACLFLLPIALGVAPAVLRAQGATAAGSVATTVPLLWATLTATFVLGIGVTIAGVGISNRGVSGAALLGLGAVLAGGAWIANLPVIAYTPYGVFRSPTPVRVGGALGLVGVVYLLGAVAYDVNARRDARTVRSTFRHWQRRIRDPLATKTLLDVHRSSGGFWKVLFSAAILLGVTDALVDLAGQITGVSPSVGVSFGAILGLSGFTTYNWLTQFDDVDSYLAHPVDVPEIFHAKFRAFLLLGPLVGVVFYAIAVFWRGAPLVEALVGGVLLVGVSCYIFGVTVYLTGLSPNEFLFDTVLFAIFGVAMGLPLVPILVVGFALAPVSLPVSGALGVGGVALGGVGVALYRRALPKWTAHHRQ